MIVLDVSQEQLQSSAQPPTPQQLSNNVLGDILQATGITDMPDMEDIQTTAQARNKSEQGQGDGPDSSYSDSTAALLYPRLKGDEPAAGATISSVAEGLVFDSRPSQAASVIVERTGSLDRDAGSAPLDIVSAAFAGADLDPDHCESPGWYPPAELLDSD